MTAPALAVSFSHTEPTHQPVDRRADCNHTVHHLKPRRQEQR